MIFFFFAILNTAISLWRHDRRRALVFALIVLGHIIRYLRLLVGDLLRLTKLQFLLLHLFLSIATWLRLVWTFLLLRALKIFLIHILEILLGSCILFEDDFAIGLSTGSFDLWRFLFDLGLALTPLNLLLGLPLISQQPC